MNEVLSITLNSMRLDIAKLDGAALNLANAQTTGYKREVVLGTSFATQLAAARASEDETAAHPITAHVDASAGALRATRQSLDLALSGPGWFEVQTEQGPAYTRQGNFRTDAQGRLVTSQGHLVAGLGGDIQLPHGMPTIDAEGRVFEGTLPGGAPAHDGANPIAQLKIVRFEEGAVLRRVGNGLVAIAGEPIPVAAGEMEVRQGFLETSNVNSAHEMVQLMQAVRHFESLQKVALGYDEMIAAAIRKLGDSA
jgi:flagellar basal-body rod protein FlgF